jgi:hypothetical protein
MKTQGHIQVRVSPYAPGDPADRVTLLSKGPALSSEMIDHLLDLGALVLKQQGRQPEHDRNAEVEFSINIARTPSPDAWIE